MQTRRLLAAVLLAALLPALAPAQRRAPLVRRPPVQRQGDEDVLRQLVREWADAAVRADVQALDRIQADNFSGNSGGRNFNKRLLREALRSGALKFAGWTIKDVVVTVRGSSAVVTGKSTLTGALFMGDDYSGDYEWTDRFVKQKDGTWRAVSSQSRMLKK